MILGKMESYRERMKLEHSQTHTQMRGTQRKNKAGQRVMGGTILDKIVRKSLPEKMTFV